MPGWLELDELSPSTEQFARGANPYTALIVLINEQTLTVGALRWSYQEANPVPAARVPVVLLHGLPAYSYAWRAVLPRLAETGLRTIAPDWIGFGNSQKPELSEFAYTPDAFVEALEALLDRLEIRKFSLVVQGFLGSAGIQYALRHPDRIERLAILNTPLSTTAKLPWRLKQLGLPLLGDMLVQNPLSVDEALEWGGFAIDLGDLGAYRRPYSASGDAGRALMTTIRNLGLQKALSEIEAGFSSWDDRFPVRVIWGEKDRYLPLAMVQKFADDHPQIKLVLVEKAGHYPQEHQPEAVTRTLVNFLKPD